MPMTVCNRSFGEIRIHRGRADANENGEIMRVETFRRTHVDGRIATKAVAHQMRVHSCGGEDHRDAYTVRADIFIGQK